jgi:hypothetical protein
MSLGFVLYSIIFIFMVEFSFYFLQESPAISSSQPDALDILEVVEVELDSFTNM